MKKILCFLLIFLSLKSFAQYPNGIQAIGNDSNVVDIKGALRARVINKVFTDTATANLSHMDEYPGAQIFTTSDNQFWLRNSSATQWIPAGGAGISIINIITDSSISICNFNSCDTFITNVTAQLVTILDDSTLLVCDTLNVCDTLHIPRTQFAQTLFDTTNIYNQIQNVYNYFSDTSFTNQFFPRGDGVLLDTAFRLTDSTFRFIYTDGTQKDDTSRILLTQENITNITNIINYIDSLRGNDTTFILSADNLQSGLKALYSTTDSLSGNDTLHLEFPHNNIAEDSVLTTDVDGDLKMKLVTGGGSSISLTTNLHTGASTLVGSTLNIPIYQANLAWVNVMDYGADSTGVADNKAAFDAALAAVKKGGTLYIPGGTFYFSTAWVCTKSVRILGEGMGKNYGYNSATKITCNTNINLWKLTAGGINIEDVGFEWTSGSAATSAKAIWIYSDSAAAAWTTGKIAQMYTFRNVSVRQFYDNVYFERASGWVMDACYIVSPVRYGVYIENTINQDEGDWSISNTQFYTYQSSGSEYGIFTRGSGGGHVSNCKFNGNGGQAYCIWVAMFSRSSIFQASNCSFENFNTEAIHVDSTNYITLTGNEFAPYRDVTGRALIYMNLTGGSTVTGNSFIYNADTAIYMTSAAATVQYNTICGNSYHNFPSTAKFSLNNSSSVYVCSDYTIGTGLQVVSPNTLQNTLLVGSVSTPTAQTVVGATTSAGTLSLTSTTDATKGKIFLGNGGNSAYDEANIRLGIGTTAPGNDMNITHNYNGRTILKITNTNATSATNYAALQLANASSNGYIWKATTGYSGYKNVNPSTFTIYNDVAGHISVLNDWIGGGFGVLVNSNNAESFRVASNGNVTANPSDTLSAKFVTTSLSTGYVGKTANYTATAADHTINFTANADTCTLPTAVGITGREYVVKTSSASACIVATTSSQTIDGATTYALTAQYKYVTVQSNGANWIIIANNGIGLMVILSLLPTMLFRRKRFYQSLR